MADRLGQQLGNYRLIRLLGQGGFADVYLGEHIHLNSQAAIKVLQMRLVGSALEQFRNEGRTIANLIHPNIVRVFDFGVDDGTPFLVMDYAPNGTLRQRYPRGTALSPATILPHFRQIARALQYAHDRKLIHRDIKPENMLLGPNNEVLLSDFGLVLPTQSTGSQTTKDMAGTLAYMAPEQINGKPRSASDQYALGIVLYEWLSGERPFHGSAIEIATQQMVTPPAPLYGKVPGLSRAVEEVLFQALAKDPLKRFARVEAFAVALEQACQRTQTDSMTFPLMASSQSPSSQSTFIKPLLSDAAQPTYVVQTPGQPSQPVSIVTPPGDTSGLAVTATPSSSSGPPFLIPGASPLPSSQYRDPTIPGPNTINSVGRHKKRPVFAIAIIMILILALVSGSVFFLPKVFSFMQGGNSSTLTQGNTPGRNSATTQALTPATAISPTATPASSPATTKTPVTKTPAPTITAVPTGPVITDYVGTWYNVDPNTRGWVRIEITAQGNSLAAHFFGACTPTPCDAGSTSAPFAGDPVHLHLDASFATRDFTLSLMGNTLHVTTFTHFTDNSGRSDYTSQDDFTTTATFVPPPTITPTVPTGPVITDYVGTWYNVDPNTRGWVRIEITAQGNSLAAHFFGACTPTPCDAGSTSAPFAGDPVHLHLDASFATRDFTLSLVGNILHVTTFTHFTDNSGRSDYTSQDDFHQ